MSYDKLKELHDAKQKCVAKIQELKTRLDNAEDSKTTNEVEQEFKEVEKEWNRLNDEYQAEQRRREQAANMDARWQQMQEDLRSGEGLGANPNNRDINSPSDLDAKSVKALKYLVMAGTGNERALTKDDREAAADLGLNASPGHHNYVTLPTGRWTPRGNRSGHIEKVRNDLSTLEGGSGGFTVPTSMAGSLEEALLAFGGLRNFATILRTSSGEEINFPMVDDTSNSGGLLGEDESGSTTSKDATFKSLRLSAYTYWSNFAIVSQELLDDSAFNMAARIGEMLGTRIGRAVAPHYTTGDGAAKPKGIVPSIPSGATHDTATDNSLGADDLITVKNKLDPAYRGMTTVYMMHPDIFTEVVKLKDSNNNYLVRPTPSTAGFVETAPEQIRGVPVAMNNEMSSSVADGNKIILYGVLDKYIIRETGSVRVARTTDKFLEENAVGFVAFWRTDGGLLDAGTNPVHLLKVK